jgi:ATP-dependent helicase YprA (DUF1998 family)
MVGRFDPVKNLRLDLDKVRANVQKADTEDLLDRATVYRGGMEPAALELIDAELRSRGVGEEAVAAHAARRGAGLTDADGLPMKCEKCRRPAVGQVWAWRRLFGVLPLFPRRMALCEVHQPASGGR